MNNIQMNNSVCIIGGGISGLTAGLLLAKKGLDVRLFEKSGEVGGNIKTVTSGGFLIEKGPNSLLKSPRLVDLVDLLGLRADVVAANPAANNRYVLRNGRLNPLPMGLKDFVLGDFFTRGAKIRLLREPFVRSKAAEGESVADFFARRLGSEVVERAVDPFISGIYAGDATRLSIESAFPKMFQMERQHGSLFWGAIRQKSERAESSFPRTFSFRDGLRTLPEKIADELGDRVSLGRGVSVVTHMRGGGFMVELDNSEKLEFGAVILAAPAGATAAMVEGIDAALASDLRKIDYPPVAVVHMGFKADSIGFTPDGFGFLVPGGEKRRILGSLWNSTVFENRAPAGYHLFTTFVGGARSPEVFDLDDDAIAGTVFGELREIMEAKSEPIFTHITRWGKAIPQYNIGYPRTAARIAEFENSHPRMYFCGNFYGGISMGDCVKKAYSVAERAAETTGAA